MIQSYIEEKFKWKLKMFRDMSTDTLKQSNIYSTSKWSFKLESYIVQKVSNISKMSENRRMLFSINWKFLVQNFKNCSERISIHCLGQGTHTTEISWLKKKV